MGRYYTGDIEGKFWFAIQSSNDADFFGVTGYQPETLEYNFSEEDVPQVKEGIQKCKTALGKHKEKLDEFFSQNDLYSDKDIIKFLQIDKAELKSTLAWYARLHLGLKILKCLEETGECNFTAEL